MSLNWRQRVSSKFFALGHAFFADFCSGVAFGMIYVRFKRREEEPFDNVFDPFGLVLSNGNKRRVESEFGDAVGVVKSSSFEEGLVSAFNGLEGLEHFVGELVVPVDRTVFVKVDTEVASLFGFIYLADGFGVVSAISEQLGFGFVDERVAGFLVDLYPVHTFL